jgi:hypothetical protein
MNYAVYDGVGRLLATRKCPFEAEGDVFNNDGRGVIRSFPDAVIPPSIDTYPTKFDLLKKLEAEQTVLMASKTCDKGMVAVPVQIEIARLRSELGFR